MCGSCCSSAANATQDCPDSLCEKTTRSCYFDNLLCLSAYSRLLNFTFCSFSKPTISHGVWSIAPDSDFRLTWGYPVSLMLLTWGMLLLPVCASWGDGVCSVWKIVDRICTSTYILYTSQILLLLNTVSSLWLGWNCAGFLKKCFSFVLVKINFFRQVSTPSSEDTSSMLCFSNCLKAMIYKAILEQQM